MMRFAESNECRMAAMVRHFGDLADSRNACGVCDFCAPDDCVGQRFRKPTRSEVEAASRAIGALRGGARPTGRLYTELFADGSITRDAFEDVLGAMARAGLARIASATFEKDGQSIPYRKIVLTAAGEAIEEGEEPEFQMKIAVESTARKRKGKAKKKAARAKGKAPKLAKAKATGAGLADALRAWRLAEAKRRGVPAFRVFNDATLEAIAEARPSSAAELLEVPGIGLKAVENYGAAIFRLVSQTH
jgi:superfamily II DNA helicase RecQ